MNWFKRTIFLKCYRILRKDIPDMYMYTTTGLSILVVGAPMTPNSTKTRTIKSPNKSKLSPFHHVQGRLNHNNHDNDDEDINFILRVDIKY